MQGKTLPQVTLKKEDTFMKIKVLLTAALTAAAAAVMGLGMISASAYELEYHTQAEIKEMYEELPFNIHSHTDYAEDYSSSSPYKIGKPSNAALTEAINSVNFIRYVAGLPYDVTLDSSLNTQTQTGSLVLYMNQVMSHTPQKPAGLTDSLYQVGYKACGESNIGLNYYNIANAVISGYVNDTDFSNIERLGHRRWVLNPRMKKTGFGIVGNATAMYSIDKSRKEDFTGDYICWPAYNTPYELVTDGRQGYAYSVSLGSSYDTPDISKVKVEVTSKLLKKTWKLSQKNKLTGLTRSSDISTYFNVETGAYGIGKCIIFNVGVLPENDEVSVKVTGIYKNGIEEPISYKVHYFNLLDEKYDSFDFDSDKYDLLLGEKLEIHTNKSPLQNGYVTFYLARGGDDPKETANATYIGSTAYLTGLKEGSFKLFIGTETDYDRNKFATINVTHQHIPSDWIISQEPDLLSTGLKYKECTICGAELETAVIPQRIIDTAEVVFAKNAFAYNGKAVIPDFKVMLDGVELVEGVDYQVSYRGNDGVGKGYMFIEALGDMDGSLSAEFDIVSALSLENCEVTLARSSYVYTGSPKTPGFTVKDGNTVLKPGSDYLFSYTSNTQKGTAYLVLTGRNNYAGSKVSIPFEITDGQSSKITISTTNGVSLNGAVITFTGQTCGNAATVNGSGTSIVTTLTEDWYLMRIDLDKYPVMEKMIYVSPNAAESIDLYRLGDIDADGSINTKDAMLSVGFAKKSVTPSSAQILRGDINADGVINTNDSMRIIAHAKKIKLI